MDVTENMIYIYENKENKG